MGTTKRVLDHVPETGTTEYYYGEDDGSFVIETVQDVTNLIEINKYLRNNAGKYGEMNLVASYPLSILMELVKQGILHTTFQIADQKKYTQWLNSPENSVWRTRDGRI